MSLANKARNKAEELAATAMQKFGRATNNRSMQAKGVARRADAKTKQAGEHMKDTADDVKDALTS